MKLERSDKPVITIASVQKLLSSSSLNVLKLAGATACSQLISIAATPLLTRLYGPEAFGLVATFASILALVNVVSSLRYELAIAVPEDDDDAVLLLLMCIVMVAISAILTLFFVAFWSDELTTWLKMPQLKPLLWFMPITVLCGGFYQSMTYWVIRCKKFGLLAKTNLRQNICKVATTLSAASLGALGLLLGQIVNQNVGFIWLLRQCPARISNSKIKPAVIINLFQRYKNFCIYSSPAGLISVIGMQIPIIIFSHKFGAEDVGLFAFSLQMLSIPVSLIGSSVSQVFLGEAPTYLREKSILKLVDHTYRKLIRIGAMIFIPLVTILISSVSWLFGDEWSRASPVMVIIAPMVFIDFIISSLSMAFVVINRPDRGLVAQASLMAIRLLPFLVTMRILSFEQSLLVYSISSSIGYLVYYLMLRHSLQHLACQS